MQIAQFWADGAGTSTPAGHWNAIASDLIRDAAMSELNAARTLAVMNVAVMDAVIACWDTKFTYWLVRPWQADPAISTPIGQPPHPSYPSGHACMSGAAARVLASVFPQQAVELERMAIELPIVVRLDGTNAQEGRRLLQEAAPPNLHVEPTMLEAAKRAVELAA